MRAMSTAALPIRSMERDDLEHRRHGLGLLGVPGGQHGHGPHVVDEVGHLVLELVDLLGHVGVAEVERGVGEVDHQLREVLGFGEHGPEVAGSGVHRGAARIRRQRRGCRRRCAGLVHTVAVRRRRLLALALAGLLALVAVRLLGDRRPHAPARRPVPPSTTTSSAPSIQPPDRRPRRVHAAEHRLRRRRRDPRRAHLHGRGGRRPTLSWTGTPARRHRRSPSSCATANAGGFVHWVVTGHRPVRAGHRRGRRAGERGGGPQRRRHRRLARPVPTRRQRHAHLRGRAPRPPGRGGAAARTPRASRRPSLLEASASERAVLTGTVTAGWRARRPARHEERRASWRLSASRRPSARPHLARSPRGTRRTTSIVRNRTRHHAGRRATVRRGSGSVSSTVGTPTGSSRREKTAGGHASVMAASSTSSTGSSSAVRIHPPVSADGSRA